VLGYSWLLKARRRWRALEQLDRWVERGPAKEPVVECEVPVEHALGGEEPDTDIVEVPVGLIFECERLRASLRAALLGGCEGGDASAAAGGAAGGEGRGDEVDVELVEALAFAFAAYGADGGDEEEGEDAAEPSAPPAVRLPWIDVAALAQLTYWYDRRPRTAEEDGAGAAAGAAAARGEEERLVDAKYGRWTKKLSREKVIYGAVALRYRSRAHLGQQVFRRPAGVDVTRLGTLRRAAALCGHGPLIGLVEETMERLQPRNVARITWEEVSRHTAKDDTWLLIDGKVYDVTPFLGLHPGGGQLIVEAAGQDATSLFERTHGEGLRYSLRLLNQFFIGVCADPNKAAPADEAQPTPEFLATLRSITGALHAFDEAKATGEAQGILR